MLNCLYVGIGGFIGSIARYLLSLIPVKESLVFPINTFAINILGAFIIGMLSARISAVNPRLMLLMKVGFCGGFTTFSTFSSETLKLFQSGHTVIAAAYALASITFGVCAVFAGQTLMH